MIRVVVAGGAGRMGGEVARMVAGSRDMKLTGIMEKGDHPGNKGSLYGVPITSDTGSLLAEADVVVDFTSPTGLRAVLQGMGDSSIPLVSGTTGLSDEDTELLKDASRHRAILWSPNMSLGVNLLFKLTGEVARALMDYDVEIVEMHHRYKKDAPSGTAKRLAEIVKKERKEGKFIYGREGQIGARSPGEVGVLALRAGDVAGEHTVFFATEGERIELTHRASSRTAFAMGTLKAIRFIKGKPKGFYEYSSLLEDK